MMDGNHRSPEDVPLDPALESDEVWQKIIQYDEALDSGVEYHLEEDETIRLLPPEARQQIHEIRETLDLLHEASLCFDPQTIKADTVLDTFPFHHSVGEKPPRTFGRFEIIQELGHGSHGIVFLAFDPRLGWQVALKVLNPAANLSSQIRRRFLREGKTLAKLKHPRIASVYEAGEVHGICYLVQSYCQGQTLQDWLKTQTTPIDCRLVACLVAEISDAVVYAHQQGVLHRDLKPSNVILIPKDREKSSPDTHQNSCCEILREFSYIPVLIDFGVAKSLEHDPQATATDGAIGTAQYMAPEQATGQTQQVGRHSDVFSLGVILYELLTRQLPVAGTNPLDTIRLMAKLDIQSVKKLRPDLPEDLESICVKCLQRDPALRYQTAAELREDLRHFLQGQLVSARRESFQKKRRQLLIRGAKLGLLVVVLFGLLFAGIKWWPKTDVQHQTSLPVSETEPIIDRLAERYADDIAQVSRLVMNPESSGPDRVQAADKAQALLDRYLPQADQRDLRGFEWHYLWKLLHPWETPPQLKTLHTIPAHLSDAYFASFSADGQRIVTCGKDRTARVWNVQSGASVVTLTGHHADVNCAVFSPDGSSIATASDDGTVCLWNAESGEKIRELWQYSQPVVGVAFHPFNQDLAAGTTDGLIRIWNLSQLEAAPREISHISGTRVDALSYSFNGKLLASAGASDGARIWNVASSYQPDDVLPFYPIPCETVSFSQNDRLVAIARGHQVRILSVDSGKFLAQIDLPVSQIRSIRFHQNERILFVAGSDFGLLLLDLLTGQSWNVTQPPAVGWCAAGSLDGTKLAMTNSDGILNLWDSAALSSLSNAVIDSFGAMPPIFSISSDGSRIAVADQSQRGGESNSSTAVTIWDTTTSPPQRVVQLGMPEGKREILDMAFSPDSREIAVGMIVYPFDLGLWFYDAATGHRLLRAETPDRHFGDSPTQEVFYSLDGSRVFTVHGTGGENGREFRLWDRQNGKLVHSILSHHQKPFGAWFPVAFSPNGNLLATTVSNEDGAIELYRVADQTKAATWQPTAEASRTLAFTPDGQTLNVYFKSGRFASYNVATGEKSQEFLIEGIRPLDHGRSPAAFSPDGDLVATVSAEGVVLAQINSGDVYYTLPFPPRVDYHYDLKFSSDGSTLAAVVGSAHQGFQTFVWRIETRAEH